MLKCIHKTPAIKGKATKFVTDFYRHYFLFEEDKTTLFDIDGHTLIQFECQDRIREAVFTNNRAIVATNTRALYFYNLKEKTTALVRPQYPIHGLFSGPDFNSFYLGTRQIRSIDFRLVSEEGMSAVFRLEGASRILSAIKRYYSEGADPIDVSIAHIGAKICVCNKTPKVKIFVKSKSIRTLKGFPLPIYTVIAPFSDALYLAGAKGNTIKVFDENIKEIFAKEVPFAIKDILTANNHIVAVCELGALFVLNLQGEIVDGGLLAQEIINCQASHDGLLWCLTADSSLMIIAREEEKETTEIFQRLHLETKGRLSPLQEAFLRIDETKKEQTTKGITLQAQLDKVHRKETELKRLESKLKKDSARAGSLIRQAQECEKAAETLIASAKALEAEMTQMDSIEKLSQRLQQHHQRTIEDKARFSEVEKEINSTVLEIQKVETRNAELTAEVGRRREELFQLNGEIEPLVNEEQRLNDDFNQAQNRLSALNFSILEKTQFINNAPQRIHSLENEEKGCTQKINELESEIAAVTKRVEEAQTARAKVEERIKEKAEQLNQILLSAEIVKQKEKDIPKIQELSQKLIALIEEVQGAAHV